MFAKVSRIAIVALITTFLVPMYTTPAQAAAPLAYESMSGTNGGSMNAVAGSADSFGFKGNWATVNGYRAAGSYSAATQYALSSASPYSSNVAFPTNSKFTLPSNNTMAVSPQTWTLNYSARELVTPVNFDANGTYYLSFLQISPLDQFSSWGSAMVGLLADTPTSYSDTSFNSLLLGWTYAGKFTIHSTTANKAAWVNPPTYSSTASIGTPTANGKSWFYIAKISTVASGNDQLQLKAFAPTDTVPATDSAISWDVTHTGAYTGNWKFLSAQTEFMGAIDEVRLGTTYDSVAGIAQAGIIGSPTVSAGIKKGIPTTITVTSVSPGYIRFYFNGKRIPGCLSVALVGSGISYTATCNWKPPTSGSISLTAGFTSTNNSYTNATSAPSYPAIGRRTNTR